MFGVTRKTKIAAIAVVVLASQVLPSAASASGATAHVVIGLRTFDLLENGAILNRMTRPSSPIYDPDLDDPMAYDEASRLIGELVNILSQNQTENRSMLDAEKDILGWNHARIGKYLLEKWKLPLSLENNIYRHHQPMLAKEPIKGTIVHMADIMANSLGIGNSGTRQIAGFDVEAWESYGLQTASFKGIIQQALHQLAPLESIFTEKN